MRSAYPAQAVREVAWIIAQSGETAVVTRKSIAGHDAFFGPHETSETLVGTIPVEMKDMPAKDLTELGSDAVACVCPDSGLQEQDFLTIEGVRYRATAVKPFNFFGQITHMEVQLTRERRG